VAPATTEVLRRVAANRGASLRGTSLGVVAAARARLPLVVVIGAGRGRAVAPSRAAAVGRGARRAAPAPLVSPGRVAVGRRTASVRGAA
jgi:hypothetical protein